MAPFLPVLLPSYNLGRGLKYRRVLYVEPLYQRCFVFLRPYCCAHLLALFGGSCCGAVVQHQSVTVGFSPVRENRQLEKLRRKIHLIPRRKLDEFDF
jgi:hypothetical protein